ncbi:762_t:CDS:1, partial [Acaulospora morrowiae]
KEQLIGYCINMQKLGFRLTKSGINHCIIEIINHQNKPHLFGEKGSGQDWWARFIRDHPELSFRTPQELSEA